MNFKISWARVFLTTQILSITLAVLAVYYLLPNLVSAIRSSENSDQAKIESKLLPQIHLSNQDDCADVILISICNGGKCQHYTESFHVICKEVFSEN